MCSPISPGRRITAVSAFLLVLISGCVKVKSSASGETGLRLWPDEAPVIAAGAKFDIAILDKCSEAEVELDGYGGKIPSTVVIDVERQTCERSVIDEIDAATSTDESVFSIAQSHIHNGFAAVSLQAKRPGTATLETLVTTSTGDYAPSGTITVQTPNRVQVTSRCGPQGEDLSSGAHQLIMSGERLTADWAIFRDTTELSGYDYAPLDISGGEHNVDTVQRTIDFGPLEQGTITVTSEIAPEFRFEVQAVTPADVDDLGFEVVRTGCRTFVELSPSVHGNELICKGRFDVDLTIESPDACAFIFQTDPHRRTLRSERRTEDERTPTFAVDSLTDEPCRIRADVIDGDYTESFELLPHACRDSEPLSGSGTRALAGTPEGNTIVLSDSGEVFVWNGMELLPRGEVDGAIAAWAASSERYWVATPSSVHAFDGVRKETFEDVGPYSAGTLAGDDVLLVGRKMGIIRDGMHESLEELQTGFDLQAVWAANADTAVAVGASPPGTSLGRPQAALWDGERWQIDLPAMADGLNGVWGTGADNVVAVGNSCVVVRFDGSAWAPDDIDCPVDLNAVHGSGADSIVAVGDEGLVALWDGDGWSLSWLRGAGDLSSVVILADGSALVGGPEGLFPVRF